MTLSKVNGSEGRIDCKLWRGRRIKGEANGIETGRGGYDVVIDG